ncbi:type II 3-dehydroquinate dehydratase [Odoribacter lunatus]|uniref:type II 3-dehydroquinate dehydratase n=1 Tax=Odoribacter lunatus TaxID=2941335 RepID=UPI00203F9A54|nr:type II 3-dehydroquinate dehydratase [Odoribacter lunatus]
MNNEGVKKILILNGPNLNLVGMREPAIYGEETFENYLEYLSGKYKCVNIEYFQSNIEGVLIDKIHEVGYTYDGIVLNAGGYTHTSVAIADAVAAVAAPVVEVHISNTAAREAFRHCSFLSPVCMGTITGFGLNSYELGIQALLANRE